MKHDREVIWLRADLGNKIVRVEDVYKVNLEEPVAILESGFYEVVLISSGKCRLVLVEACEDPGYPA